MTIYRLSIPTFKERHRRELWWVADDVSSGTLYRTGGSWHFERSPNNTTLVEAEHYFRGGYENFVGATTAAALTSAGFGDWLEEYIPPEGQFSGEFTLDFD